MFVNSSFYDVSVAGIIVSFLAFTLIEKFTPDIKLTLVIALSIRLIFVFLFPTPPFSDYLTYHTAAKNLSLGLDVQKEYFTAFPHALGYSVLLSVIYKIFGAKPEIVYFINAFISTASIYLIYKCVFALFNDKKLCEKVAFLVSLFPAGIFYNSMLATEILYTFFMFLTVLLVLKQKTYRLSILIGITIFCLNFIRPTGIICITAYITYILINKEKLKNKALKIAVMLFTYLIFVFLGNNLLSLIVGEKLTYVPFGYNLYVGMNKESLGRWNEADYKLAMSMADNAEAMHSKMAELTRNRIKENGFWGTIKLICEKFALTWGSGTLVCSYLKENWLFSRFFEIFVCLSQGFQVFLGYICLRNFKNDISGKVLFPILLILGTVALHLFAETMERYVYTSEIMIMMISAKKGTVRCLKS